MKTKLMATALVLVLCSISMGLVYAQPGDKCDRPHHGKGLMNIPDLTEEQMSKIESMGLEHQKQMLPLRTKVQEKRLEMRSMILENADKTKIEKKIDEIGGIQTEMMKKRISHELDIRNLLTDKQKVHFDMMHCAPHRMHERLKGHGFMGRHFEGPDMPPEEF